MENNIFDQVGKKMPYRVPEGYFDASEKELRSIVHRKSFNRKLYYAAAASVVLAVGIWSLVRFIPHQPQTPMLEEPIYVQTYDTADDWHEFAEADLFLDNMNW